MQNAEERGESAEGENGHTKRFFSEKGEHVMSIELLIDQQPAGTFTVSRDGLYTVFEAAAPKATGLVRLWVHGDGKSACPWPAEAPEEGLLWYSRGDGTLTAFDGISSLLALPAELRAPDAHTAERVIEGKKYLVFRY